MQHKTVTCGELGASQSNRIAIFARETGMIWTLQIASLYIT